MRPIIVIALILIASPAAAADGWNADPFKPQRHVKGPKPFTVPGEWNTYTQSLNKPFTTPTIRWPDPRRMCMQFGCDHPL